MRFGISKQVCLCQGFHYICIQKIEFLLYLSTHSKTKSMHQTWILIKICITLFLCVNCTPRYQANEQLQMALRTVDDDPKKALLLLDSISSPQSLSKDDYMHYVVTLTQARYMDYQDITCDARILEAVRYFTKKENPDMAGRAAFYTAAYYNENKDERKTLEYQRLANGFARRAGNQLFQAKSAHWIGNIYNDKSKPDSAKVYYSQAQKLYPDDAKNVLNRLEVNCMLGLTCCELNQLEEAQHYLDMGMEMAQQLNNQLYEALFAHFKGMVFCKRREYPEAKHYFDLALSKRPGTEDSLRIYLSYAELYKYAGKPDSTKYYLDLVKKRFDDITSPRVRKWAFDEFEQEFEQRLKRNKYLKTIRNTLKSFK